VGVEDWPESVGERVVIPKERENSQIYIHIHDE
jgi:hypothetical protein